MLFSPYQNDSDDFKDSEIRELRNLMDIKYFDWVPDDVLEHLRDNTSAKDIIGLIKKLNTAVEELNEAKGAYNFLHNQHEREGEMMQKVLKNYIDEKRQLKAFIRKINKRVPRNLC